MALASQGERAERVGVTQAMPIQNFQLTPKKTEAVAALANLQRTLVAANSMRLATPLSFHHSHILINNKVVFFFNVLCLSLFGCIPLYWHVSLSVCVCFEGVLFSRVGLAVGPGPAAFGWTLMNGTGVGTSDEAGHAVN